MAILTNIVVTEADLLRVRPDINNYLKYEGQSLEDVIETAKRAIYREIKEHEQKLYPGYSDAEIELRLQKVRDYENEQALKDKIIYLVIAELMAANDHMADQVAVYSEKAKRIPLHYWVDVNQDNVISDAEKRTKRVIIFGR